MKTTIHIISVCIATILISNCCDHENTSPTISGKLLNEPVCNHYKSVQNQPEIDDTLNC